MIIFIYGPDTFRSREKLREVISQFQKKRDATGMNVVRLSGEKLEFDRLRQETLTQGFLSPKKMIVIERLLENNSEELFSQVHTFLKNFSNNNDDNVLVFWEADFKPKKKSNADKAASKLFTYLTKLEYVFEFEEFSAPKLHLWIKSRVTSLGGKINQQATYALAASVGGNLWQLANDIDKLVACNSSEEITEADVYENTKGKFEENIFALTDAIAMQNKPLALKLLSKEIENGANTIYLLTMIIRQFRIITQLQSALTAGNSSSENLAKQLKLHPFVVKKSIPVAKNYSVKNLKLIYSRLVIVDQRLKHSYPNPELLLDKLILS